MCSGARPGGGVGGRGYRGRESVREEAGGMDEGAAGGRRKKTID